MDNMLRWVFSVGCLLILQTSDTMEQKDVIDNGVKDRIL